VLQRVVIFGFEHNDRYPDADPVPYTEIVNPVLTPLGTAMEEDWEGCLSVPGLRGRVPRAASLRYTGFDPEGRRIEREGMTGHPERILAATLFVGCAWTDSKDTGMSVVVTADRSRAASRAAAIHLGQRIWNARHQFAFGCETADFEKGIMTALEAKEPTVFLTDSGDNVTAGTPGDLPLVLRRLLESKALSSGVVCLHYERSRDRSRLLSARFCTRAAIAVRRAQAS
jgi:hypothetical protein